MTLRYALRIEGEAVLAELGIGLGAPDAVADRLAARLAPFLDTKDPEDVARGLLRILGSIGDDWALGRETLWQRHLRDPRTPLVLRLALAGGEEAARLRDLLAKAFPERARLDVDPPVAALDAWVPGPGGVLFADRPRAEALIGAGALRDLGARGQGVNVLVVDGGLDWRWVRAEKRRLGAADAASARVLGWTRRLPRRGGGFDDQPPGTRGTRHAEMIARSILSLAPEATLWDVPLIADPMRPPGIATVQEVQQWIRDAVNLGEVESFDASVNEVRRVPFGRPLVLVNAWGVFDTGQDAYREYADDPAHPGLRLALLADRGGLDVVFAAGNCGEPAPDPRCGEHDRGPGRGISGLNAHPAVLSVGAVRADGFSVAVSSQGPGRLAPRWAAYAATETLITPRSEKAAAFVRAARARPDLCAPSHFREAHDAALWGTGSSCAAGVAAGVLAALRSLPALRDVEPALLREALRLGARPAPDQDAPWHPRYGAGVLDVPGTLAALATTG